MAWIESHQELGRHPKTRKAARRLGITIPQMMGHLHLLWHWALDYADTGDLTDHDDEDIALGAMWEGEPADFVQVLTDVGFLESDRQLHDWMDYAGRLVRDRIRKREERAVANDGPSKDSPRTDVGQSVDRARARTLPNPTQPDQTKPKGGSRKRAHQLPDDWSPSDELLAEQQTKHPNVNLERELEKFRNHWRSKGETRKDWSATWRNWVIKAEEFGSGARASPKQLHNVAEITTGGRF